MASQRESTLTPEVIFGRHLRRLREDRGWSQAVVATKLATFHGIELHFSAIAKMEGAHRLVRLNEAVALAEIFDVPLAEMLSTEGINVNHAEALAILEDKRQALLKQVQGLEEAKQYIRDRAKADERRMNQRINLDETRDNL